MRLRLVKVSAVAAGIATVLAGVGLARGAAIDTKSSLGKVSINGAVSTYILSGTKVVNSDRNTFYDVGSAVIDISKEASPVGFEVLAGAYATPVLGSPLSYAADTTKTLSPIPVAYLKFKAIKGVELDIGRMPTLIGYESAFTYQNPYIQRGLVWNMQPVLHDGIRASFSYAGFDFKAGINDGYYSASTKTTDGKLVISPAVEFSISKELNSKLSLSFNCLIPSKSAKPNDTADPANKEQYDIVGSYSFGKLSVGFDTLYVYAPKDDEAGVPEAAKAFGTALHFSYLVSQSLSLNARLEYVKDFSDKGQIDLVGLGDDNSAVTFTLSPEYEEGSLFVKGELSYVKASKNFTYKNKDFQVRGGFEVGLKF
ncbi:MAG: porin [Thermodesulfobacteria bacterium]|nr:porin [Thermodesulfobacteriota bacterium]